MDAAKVEAEEAAAVASAAARAVAEAQAEAQAETQEAMDGVPAWVRMGCSIRLVSSCKGVLPTHHHTIACRRCRLTRPRPTASTTAS